MQFPERLEDTPFTQDLGRNQKYGSSFNTGVQFHFTRL